MEENVTRVSKSVAVTSLVILLFGCTDERVVQISREAADRQADQNKTMARLVEKDIQSRQQLHAQRGQLNNSWNQLEAERQSIARDRRTVSLFHSFGRISGVMVLAVLSLGFAWMALFGLRQEQSDAGPLCEMLIQQVANGQLPLTPVTENRQLIANAKNQNESEV
jgi:hypothetical protein